MMHLIYRQSLYNGKKMPEKKNGPYKARRTEDNYSKADPM